MFVLLLQCRLNNNDNSVIVLIGTNPIIYWTLIIVITLVRWLTAAISSPDKQSNQYFLFLFSRTKNNRFFWWHVNLSAWKENCQKSKMKMKTKTTQSCWRRSKVKHWRKKKKEKHRWLSLNIKTNVYFRIAITNELLL